MDIEEIHTQFVKFAPVDWKAQKCGVDLEILGFEIPGENHLLCGHMRRDWFLVCEDGIYEERTSKAALRLLKYLGHTYNIRYSDDLYEVTQISYYDNEDCSKSFEHKIPAYAAMLALIDQWKKSW